MDLVIKKGLNIPIKGKAKGNAQTWVQPTFCSLNVSAFDELQFKVHCKVGDHVKIGQSLLESKNIPGLQFVSPAGGEITEVRRGAKRRLLNIVIKISEHEEHLYRPPIFGVSKEKIIERFLEAGLFSHIRSRPLNFIAHPTQIPRDIFITAVETLPFAPPEELQVEGLDIFFQAGIDALVPLTSGNVHLVFSKNTSSQVFLKAKNVQKHTVCGPHPAGNVSTHIHYIAPIQQIHDYVWCLSALDVVVIGKMMLEGQYYTRRIVSIAGEGIKDEKRQFVQTRAGASIADLVKDRKIDRSSVLVSGDPLIGTEVEERDFLGFFDKTVSVIPENVSREPLHFFKWGIRKYTGTRTYLSGHFPFSERTYSFTTNQHGEERAFIDGEVYNKVMPLHIPTMQLVKAVLANDFELAEQLGLLEIAREDFALAEFICPSKIEMMHIIKEGIYRYAKEMGLA